MASLKFTTVSLRVPAFVFTRWFRLAALIGLALCGLTYRLSVIRAQNAGPTASQALTVPSNRNVFDGEPTYLPCGHLRGALGSRGPRGVTRFICTQGHTFRHDQWGWSADNGAGTDIPLR